MKYVRPGIFTTNQFSIAETITETDDVVRIALAVLRNINNVSDDVKKELDHAIRNLNEATEYLTYIARKTNKALEFVPKDVQEKEFL